MRKIKAFFTALLLFAAFALAMHYGAESINRKGAAKLGSWTNEKKFKATSVLREAIDDNTTLVFGSSELEHGRKTPYQLLNIARDQELNIMAIGAGYYQSLFHATALAALSDELTSKKVVLILSPQWFRKTGVVDKAFASRFSETNYIEMLKNEAVSSDVKKYISKRTKKLLKVDPKTRERVKRYEREFMTGTASRFDLIQSSLYRAFLDEKARITMAQGILTMSRPVTTQQPVTEEGTPDFDLLRENAAADGEEASGGNEFFVTEDYYKRSIMPRLESAKEGTVKTGYSESPEYEDLECFLKVCEDLDIEPLLVIIPVNGYWYDYINFTQDHREKYYDNIRALAKEYDVETADFSDREYEEYFMEDTVHIGWKGWVDVSEAIFRYANE